MRVCSCGQVWGCRCWQVGLPCTRVSLWRALLGCAPTAKLSLEQAVHRRAHGKCICACTPRSLTVAGSPLPSPPKRLKTALPPIDFICSCSRVWQSRVMGSTDTAAHAAPETPAGMQPQAKHCCGTSGSWACCGKVAVQRAALTVTATWRCSSNCRKGPTAAHLEPWNLRHPGRVVLLGKVESIQLALVLGARRREVGEVGDVHHHNAPAQALPPCGGCGRGSQRCRLTSAAARHSTQLAMPLCSRPADKLIAACGWTHTAPCHQATAELALPTHLPATAAPSAPQPAAPRWPA